MMYRDAKWLLSKGTGEVITINPLPFCLGERRMASVQPAVCLAIHSSITPGLNL